MIYRCHHVQARRVESGQNAWVTFGEYGWVILGERRRGVIEEASPSPVGTNHLHALQEMFERRLRNGQCFATPFLGLKEFTPSYVGPYRAQTVVEETITLEIPSMLHSVFDQALNGKWGPRFVQNARIEKGVLEYA